MKTLATLLLGIVIGMAGLLVVQRPGSIAVMRAAFDVGPSPPPVIRVSYPGGARCAIHPQFPCK